MLVPAELLCYIHLIDGFQCRSDKGERMKNHRWNAACFILLLIGLSLPPRLAASGFDFVYDQPGKLTAPVTVSNIPHKLLSKAETSAYQRNLERLRDLLAKQPVFNPARGVEVIGYFRPLDDLRAFKNKPFPGFGYLRFHFYHLQKKTGKPVRICCTTDEMHVSVNNPDTGLDVFGASEFPTKAFYEPQRVGELAGFPVYRLSSGSDLIVLSRNRQKPWVPVTREEYVTAWLAYWEKMAAANAPYDPISPQIVSSHRAALAAMSPEERTMQARHYPADPLEPTLAPVGSREGQPLVRTNPAWFDPALPKTAFQLITIRFNYSGDLDHDNPGPTEHGDIAPYRVWQALQTSNWGEIGKALER